MKKQSQASGLLGEEVNEKLPSSDLVQEKLKLQNANSSKGGERVFWNSLNEQ